VVEPFAQIPKLWRRFRRSDSTELVEVVALQGNLGICPKIILLPSTGPDRTVVDPEPLEIRLIVQPETGMFLGCQAVGEKAAEIVNLAATALNTGLSVTQLSNLAIVHPSASEALVRCLQSRFDKSARSTVGA
jgi:pyridine nucleotide-disulfide oxidoreductase